MSNMENMDGQMAEKARQHAVYEQAMAELTAAPRVRPISEYKGSTVASNPEDMFTHGAIGKMAHNAQLFCIAFAMITPVLLLWAHIF